MKSLTKEKRIRRHIRIRSRISGTPSCPRLSVSRSSRFMRVQLIDDTNHKTLFSASDVKLKKGTKTERARLLGSEIAKKATEKGITKAVFDRGGFRYHGRIQAVADAAREGGLLF